MSHAAARMYRAATHLYPRAFREEYGDDLVALFEAQCSDESPVRVYARTTVDLLVTVPIRHLEVPMHDRAPTTMVIVYVVIALGGLTTVAIGGTNEVAATLGLLVAAVAGALAVVTARRQAAAPSDPSSIWWKVTTAGIALIAAVMVGARIGIEAWYLAWVAALGGIALIAVGLVLGVFRLFHRARPPAIG